MDFYNLLFILSTVLGFAYFFIRHRYAYWKRLNIPYVQPEFPFGNLGKLRRNLHGSVLFQQFYDELKGSSAPFGGIYLFIKPTVLATSLDFVKLVLIKDFNYFENRGVYYNERDDPMSGNLFTFEGDRWRTLRNKLTPAFTLGKIRVMFPSMISVADEVKSKIDSLMIDASTDVEIKEILSRYTIDVIGSCAFGIECNSLKNDNSEFRIYLREVFRNPRNPFLKQLLLLSFKNFARKLKMKLFADDVTEFIMTSVKETLRYREENNIQRNDFLNMMMQLQKHSGLDGDEVDADSVKDQLSFNEIAAQCFVFFVAGFETSATNMMFCLFELSKNQELQKKARQEVIDVLRRHNGEFTYEAMMEMHFLDRCSQEALRKYPPVPNLLRTCTKDYAVPDTDITIRKGTLVIIPAFAIHRDPEIYENPDVFDPDRFLPENVRKRHPLSFVAFGDGPRNCIGLRFGQMQVRLGLATILKNYELSPCASTVDSIVSNSKLLNLTPEGGLWLNLTKYREC